MAAATATAPDSSSPRTPNVNNRGVLSSPWAQVVKGAGELPEKSESPPPVNLPASDGNVGKKSAWKKPVQVMSIEKSTSPPPSLTPTSGGDHGGGGGGGVMGGISWPALSESTRFKSSSSSFDYSKSTPVVSVPLSQGPATSHVQQSKSNTNSNRNLSMNSAAPTRQRSMKRGGNRQGGFARGPPPPPPPPLPLPSFRFHGIAQSSFTKRVTQGPELSLRDSRPTRGFASHSNSSNEHSNHRSSNRRGNFGQHGRGDGRNNYHGQDQDYGNHDRTSSPSPHGRGAHVNPHRPHTRGFMGPPVQGTPPFAPPPPVRPYGNALVYPVLCFPSPPTDSFSRMAYPTGPPPPPYLVMSDDSDSLRVSIIKQIEYYFSDANLVKDAFLRSKMDEQGWVPITLIASFPRVQNLSDSIPFILDCLRGSTIVEVQGDKVRRFNDWLKWIAHQQSPSNSSGESPFDYDNLTTSIQSMSLEVGEAR